jgi:hypothetical protein
LKDGRAALDTIEAEVEAARVAADRRRLAELLCTSVDSYSMVVWEGFP